MKKLYALLLAAIMVLSVCTACGRSSGNATEPKVTQAPTQPRETTVPIDATVGKIVDPANGTKLSVNFTTPGTVQSGAEAISSGKININGVSYDFPMTVQQLLDNGWSFAPNAANTNPTVEAGQTMSLISYDLYTEGIDWLSLGAAQNNSDAAKPLNECLIAKLQIDIGWLRDTENKLDFVLPGGIAWDSTAADVLAAFGPVAENPDFRFVQVGEKFLRYVTHSASGISYYSTFNDDGTLYSLSMELAN